MLLRASDISPEQEWIKSFFDVLGLLRSSAFPEFPPADANAHAEKSRTALLRSDSRGSELKILGLEEYQSRSVVCALLQQPIISLRIEIGIFLDATSVKNRRIRKKSEK